MDRIHATKKLVLVLLAATSVSCTSQPTSDNAAAGQANKNVAAWEKQARNVTIIRDEWGIAHVYGKTDADAVFGVMFAQAEDDFNRVETNYLNSIGRLAEAEGEAEMYRDLRTKIPALLKAFDRTSAANPLKAKLAEQIAVLRGWDFRWSVTSVPRSLAVCLAGA